MAGSIRQGKETEPSVTLPSLMAKGRVPGPCESILETDSVRVAPELQSGLLLDTPQAPP